MQKAGEPIKQRATIRAGFSKEQEWLESMVKQIT